MGATPASPERAKIMYYTYVIQSQKDKKLYVGYTQDLKIRFAQHDHGDVTATKNRRPFTLIYYEACTNKHDAIKREKYFKTGFGRRFLNNRLENFYSQARDGGQGKERQKVVVKKINGAIVIRDYKSKK